MIHVKHACVIGWPIEHSRSPLLHGYWLKKYQIPGRYDRIAVSPETLDSFIDGFAGRGFVGGNVTIPHKEAVFRRVAVADPLTARLGSVNTLYLSDGTLYGTSTDGYGFVASAKQAVKDLDFAGIRVTVLGAGGAARSILGALLEQGVGRISVANRSPERAEAFAAEFGQKVEVVPWHGVDTIFARTDMLVNATSLGMTGKDPLRIDLSPLPAHAVVCDIVYVPLLTPLLMSARSRGLRIIDGLGMLMHQAVPGFERWFGVRPEVTAELRSLLEADVMAKK